MPESPQMLVVGGPNGAGKTTFVRRLIAAHGFPYLGADKFAADIRPDAPETVAFEAGREFLQQVAAHTEHGESFILESTLSGRGFAKSLQRARASGFAIDTTLVFVASANKSVERVAERVRKGGHHVPEADVRRRFSRSLANFWRLYRPLSDRWSIVYNAQDGLVGIAHSVRASQKITNPPLFAEFLRFAGIDHDDLATTQ